MILLFLITALIGVCVGLLLGQWRPIRSLKIFNRSNPKPSSYIRRGLYKSKYTKSSDGSNINATFEIGELESADELSKIVVLNVKTNTTCNSEMILNLKNMVDNSWVETSDIKWITTRSAIRNEKIDELLK